MGRRSVSVAVAGLLCALIMPASPSSARGGAPLVFKVIIVEDRCTVRASRTAASIVGDDVEWFNTTAEPRSIDESSDLWSYELEPGQTHHGSAAAAGYFRQRCQDGPSERWRVKMKATPGNTADPSFRVRWAAHGTRASWRFRVDVQRGNGAWRVWKRSTPDKSDVYPGRSNGVYRLRCRVVDTKARALVGWSPPIVVHT